MSNITSLRAARQRRHGSHTLCRSGHHKWKIITERKFDVKQGRLVTVFQCERCKKEKVKTL